MIVDTNTDSIDPLKTCSEPATGSNLEARVKNFGIFGELINDQTPVALSFNIPHCIELGTREAGITRKNTDPTMISPNGPMIFNSFPRGDQSLAASWITTLRYHCDDIMTKTDAHIQVQSNSSTFNFTIFGTIQNAMLAKSLLLRAGIYQAKQTLTLPVEISQCIPYDVLNASGDALHEANEDHLPVELSYSLKTFGPKLKRKLDELVNQHGMVISWNNFIQEQNHGQSKDNQVAPDVNLWNLTLTGPLQNIHKARESILTYFDELSSLKRVSIPVDPLIVTIASGPFRSYYEALQCSHSDNIKECGYVKIYMPNAVHIESNSLIFSNSIYPSSQVIEDEDRQNLHGLSQANADQLNRSHAKRLPEEANYNLILTGPSKSCIERFQRGIERLLREKETQTILSRSMTIDVQKLEILIHKHYEYLQKLCFEYGLYMKIQVNDLQPVDEKYNGNNEAIITMFMENHPYRMEEAVKRMEELVCKYFSIEILVHPENSNILLDHSLQNSHSITKMMSPLQPHCNVVKFKNFQKDIQQLRTISHEYDIEIYYYQSAGRVTFFGDSIKLMHAIDKYTCEMMEQTQSDRDNAYYQNHNRILSAQVLMEQPSDVKEFVCGKKDGKLNKIMRYTRSMIKIYSWHDWSICVSLYAQSISEMIEGLVMVEGELPSEVSFHIPEIHHKRIIGHGGKNIQRIMKTFGVYVKFLSDEDIKIKYGSGEQKQNLDQSTKQKVPHSSGAEKQQNFPRSWSNVIVKTPAKNAPALIQMKNAIMELSGEKDDLTIVQDTVNLPVIYHYNWFFEQREKIKDQIFAAIQPNSIQGKCIKNIADIFWPPVEWNTNSITLRGVNSTIQTIKNALLSVIPICATWILCMENGKFEDIVFGHVVQELKSAEVFLADTSCKLQECEAIIKMGVFKHIQTGSIEKAEGILQRWCNNNRIKLYLQRLPGKGTAYASFKPNKEGEIPNPVEKKTSAIIGDKDVLFDQNQKDGPRKGSLPLMTPKDSNPWKFRSRSIAVEKEEVFKHFNSILLSGPTVKVSDSMREQLPTGLISKHLSPPPAGSSDYYQTTNSRSGRSSTSPTGTIGERGPLWNIQSGGRDINAPQLLIKTAETNVESLMHKKDQPKNTSEPKSDGSNAQTSFSSWIQGTDPLEGLEISEEQRRKHSELFITSITPWKTPITSEKSLGLGEEDEKVNIKILERPKASDDFFLKLSSNSNPFLYSYPQKNERSVNAYAIGLQNIEKIPHIATNQTNDGISEMSSIDIAEFIRGIGLERYLGIFTGRNITLDVLINFTEEDMIMIGVTPSGVRRKLLLALETHKNGIQGREDRPSMNFTDPKQ